MVRHRSWRSIRGKGSSRSTLRRPLLLLGLLLWRSSFELRHLLITAHSPHLHLHLKLVLRRIHHLLFDVSLATWESSDALLEALLLSIATELAERVHKAVVVIAVRRHSLRLLLLLLRMHRWPRKASHRVLVLMLLGHVLQCLCRWTHLCSSSWPTGTSVHHYVTWSPEWKS